ncbi:putative quinol monooxygenase [Photobacterium sp. 1_MG-2023]|uniref:putative quinol monooxygenase n=1 Tax=Photobacterium sp. 1_MG-2023 TaxID=3062646 RepID=UPI0026E12CDC|nr:antibiotic biosynthesis monooxygenase [Photobacterium sp. 1_MG-2023]MDO6708194.1 antibiotic biosynthesis monooxygenase [Photobacterium sp. 1_MG-2023]
MFCIVVKNVVKNGFQDQYLAIMKENAKASVETEAGCLTFDVLVSQNDDHCFYLYEIYTSEAALAEHKQTSHYLDSRRRLEGLIEEQSVIRCDALSQNHS